MADKVVDLGGSDLFSLGATFGTTRSESLTVKDLQENTDGINDSFCSSMTNERTEYTQDANYCNATPDIDGDLADLLAAFGQVANSKAPTELTVTFEAGKHATVSITGHNHAANAHTALRNCDASGIIPASSGLGVPAFFADAGTNSSPIRATFRVSCDHIDEQDTADGHWVGQSTHFRVDVEAEYIGTPSLTTTDWNVDSQGSNEGNTTFDHYTIKAHKFIDSAAAS